MKKFKRCMAVVLALAFVIGGFAVGTKNVSAHEINREQLTHIHAEENESYAGSNARINTVCGNYTSHYMVSKGIGIVVGTKGDLIPFGSCFQCSRCNLVFICEGDPLLVNGYDATIGRYATTKVAEPISNNGAVMYVGYSSLSQLPYCGSSRLSGYTFTGGK